MSERKWNVGVAGLGFGSVHISRGILPLPDIFTLKRICDPDSKRLEYWAAKQELTDECLLSTDYHDLLDDLEIDIICLSLPHHLHHIAAVEAAEAGKHIMLDKPIARTLKEADLIIQAAEKNNVQLMIAFNFRFDPLYSKIRELLNDGAIGRPVLGNTRHYQPFRKPAGSNWYSRESVGGGCVIGSGIHNIDMMRYLLGEPEQVFAYGVSDPGRLEGEAAAAIVFKYPDNLAVTFLCNWADSGSGKTRNRCGEWELYGNGGDLTSFDGKLRIGGDFGTSEKFIDIPQDDAFTLMWQHFGECLDSGRQPLTNGREGRASLKLVLKVYESIETNQPVFINTHALAGGAI